MKEKMIRSIVGLLLAIILFVVPNIPIPYFDNNADEYFTAAMEKAAIAYGTTAIINSSVSVIKESDVTMEPAGFGLSLAIGEILDPVDDMTERLSDILVTSIASLGIQRIIFEIGITFIPKLLAIVLLLLAILIWFDMEKINKISKFLIRMSFLLLIFRLLLPVSSVLNDILYGGYFEPQITEATNQLELYSQELDTFKDFQFPDSDGVWETITNSAAFLSEKTIQFSDAFVAVVDNLGGIIDNLLLLSWLYLGLFVVQVIALPLLMFWVMIKLVNVFFETKLPTMLKSSSIITKEKKLIERGEKA